MDKLINQDWTNTFINCDINDRPYNLICAGEGARNVILPNGQTIDCSDLKRDLGFPQLFA